MKRQHHSYSFKVVAHYLGRVQEVMDCCCCRVAPPFSKNQTGNQQGHSFLCLMDSSLATFREG